MSKFKVGDLVVISNPCLHSQLCYKNTTHRITWIDPEDNTYYFDDIRDEEADMVPWEEHELEFFIEPVEILYPNMMSMRGKSLYEAFHKHVDDVALKYCMDEIAIANAYCEKMEEEKEMNKVLNLWYDRKQRKIIDEYDNKEYEYINNHSGSVQSYNELVKKFEEDLEELFKYDKATEQFYIMPNNSCDYNTYKYEIDINKLGKEFDEKFINERNEKLTELERIRDEVEAQLSLSDDLEYQTEVLIRYGIIDKKTKKISE